MYKIYLTCPSASFTRLACTHKFEHSITCWPIHKRMFNSSYYLFEVENDDPCNFSIMDDIISFPKDNNICLLCRETNSFIAKSIIVN